MLTTESGFGAIVDSGVLTETHTIKVKAFDRAGNEAESEPVQIRVMHKPKEQEDELAGAAAMRRLTHGRRTRKHGPPHSSADRRLPSCGRQAMAYRSGRLTRDTSAASAICYLMLIPMPHILITNDDGYQAPAPGGAGARPARGRAR